MHPEAKEQIKVWFKLRVLDYASHFGATEACKDFKVAKSSYYEWKNKFDKEGKMGLFRKKPIALSHPRKTPSEIIDKILELRKEYNLGAIRIMYYLERYHGLNISESTVSRTLRKHGLSRLPKSSHKRTVHTKRYVKTVPGHHVQVDVKFLILKDVEGRRVRRFQYTAVDDATRIRALQIYPKHNQDCAIMFMDYVVEKFPFRIHTVQTDNGHEFQARFHWHVEDQGMQHRYIKARTPQLNGKVERSHRTDQDEFYQLLTYIDDVDLMRKLEVWEQFYNYDRPHMSHGGKTPYEVMKSLLT